MGSNINASGMHRALKIPEILIMVAENLGTLVTTRRSPLHSMVLTSRAFKDAALPYLWRRLTSVMPLARLIMLDIDNREEAEEIDGVLLSKRSFQSFHSHLAFVESVAAMRDDTYPNDTFLLRLALETLMRDNRRPIAAPRLRELAVSSWTGLTFRWVDLLLGCADLVHLQLETPNRVSRFDESVCKMLTRILQSVPLRGPNLTKLEIGVPSALMRYGALKQQIIHSATNLPNLVRLCYRFPIDSAFLQHLPSRLHHLELELGIEAIPRTRCPELPDLHRLVLSGSIGNISQVLPSLQLPALFSLKLAMKFTGINTGEAFNQAATALGHSLTGITSQLRSLDLQMLYHYIDDDLLMIPLAVDSIPPLPNLEDLDIRVSHGNRLMCTDWDIINFARTWPALRTLRIMHIWDDDDNDEILPITIVTGLQPLAMHCSHLTRLTLAVDLRDFDPVKAQPCTPQPAMRFLELDDGTVFEPDDTKHSLLKSFIATMWPNVRLMSLAADERIRLFCETFNEQRAMASIASVQA